MNQIHYLTSENEYETLKRILSERSDTFIAELDGAKCHSNWKSFYKLAKTAFGIALFPEDNIDGLADSLMDLFWIKQTKVALFLKNSHQFECFDDQPRIKRGAFLELLEEDILPWWEKDVLTKCVGGQTKDFQVYVLK